MTSCQSNQSEQSLDFSNYSEIELDSIAERYYNIANNFIQPSSTYRRYMDSAILVRPHEVEHRQVASYSYKKRGEHITAMKMLNESVETDLANGGVDALQYRIWTLLYFYRDYEGTLRDIQILKEMTKRDYDVCWGEPCGFQEGQAYYRLNKFKEAISAFDTVIDEEEKQGFDPKANFMLYFYMGRCYFELNQYEKAIECYDIALETDKNYSEAIFHKGNALLKLGNKKEAKKLFEEALYWVQKGKRMSEPYIERFDELYPYMVEEALAELDF